MRTTILVGRIRTPASSSDRFSAAMFFPSFREPHLFFRCALLRVLRAGFISSFAAVDAGIRFARRFSGLPSAEGKSRVPPYRPVSQPVFAPGAALWICLAAGAEDCRARRIRGVLHQHERAELSERSRVERAALATIFGECQLRWRTAERANAHIPEYPAGEFAAVPGFSGHFVGFASIQGARYFAS